MSIYELFTGRRPDAPRAAGNTVMSNAALARWDRMSRSLLCMAALWFLPLLSFAQGGSDPNLDFGMDDSQSSQIVSSLYTIWRVVANSAVYIGAIVAIVALVFGLGARWVYMAAGVAIIGGFGEWAVQWILELGGMEIVEQNA